LDLSSDRILNNNNNLLLCCRVYQGPQATLEQLERMESQVCQAHPVYQGQLVEEARGGSQGKGAQWDLLGDLDLVVRLDLKDLMDCQ
jgi:hypothetical protein